MLISAGIVSAGFCKQALADSAYTLSGTAIFKGSGHAIGDSSTGIFVIGKRESGCGLQAININLTMLDKSISGSLQYRIYVNKKGWQPWTDNGQITGLTTMPRQVTGIEMRLTGDLADAYSIWYSAWTDKRKDKQGWVCDGAQAGSPVESRKIEELQVMLVRRNRITGNTAIHFRSYVRSYGWDKAWMYSGHYTGRPGRGKLFQGIEIFVTGTEYTGGVKYRTLSGTKWLGWTYNGEFSGAIVKSRKIQAIEIQLTGEVAQHYDIYYRSYVGGLGWFNWSKNGEASGSKDIGRHIEGIQIALVRKGSPAPSALGKIKSRIGYSYVSKNPNVGVSEWKISSNGSSNSFGAAVLRRAKHYNRTEYKDMRCDALVAQVLVDTLGTNLGKASKKSQYPRLNEWIGLSALENLLSSTFTYKDAAGRTVICRPVGRTKLKPLFKKVWVKTKKKKWKRKEEPITEAEFNEWIIANCKPGDIVIYYNKNKKPIHCAIYSGIQNGSTVEYEYFRGKRKGKKDSDIRQGPYMWHSGYDTGVSNRYAVFTAEIGRAKYVKRYRVDSGLSQPAPPKQK